VDVFAKRPGSSWANRASTHHEADHAGDSARRMPRERTDGER
jgi:hypothetical protein